MILILYVNEVRYATRATQWPSFFVRMRFGEKGEASFASVTQSKYRMRWTRRGRGGASKQRF